MFNTKITFIHHEKQGEILNSVKTKKEKPVQKLNPKYECLLHKNNFYFKTTKQLNKFPINFLQSLQHIKSETQNNTLNLIIRKVA